MKKNKIYFITGKLWLPANSEPDALEFIISYSIYDNYFYFSASYLWYIYGLIKIEKAQLPVFLGAGLEVALECYFI